MADLAAAATVQGQQGAPANLTEVSNNAKALHNCQAVATLRKNGNSCLYRVKDLLHDHKLDAYLGCSPPYEVVLQEKLGPTSFRLYIKPQHPGAPRAPAGSSTGSSLAGQGMGLQVFPGSVTEAVQDCSIHKRQNASVILFPKQLVLSQLHHIVATNGRAAFPVKVQLTIVDSGAPGPHSIAEQAKVYWWSQTRRSSEPGFRLVGPPGSVMSSHVGRRVVHTSMTADRHITITLAPQAATPATPAAPAVNDQAAPPAAAATTGVQPGAGANPIPAAAPSTAAAAAAQTKAATQPLRSSAMSGKSSQHDYSPTGQKPAAQPAAAAAAAWGCRAKLQSSKVNSTSHATPAAAVVQQTGAASTMFCPDARAATCPPLSPNHRSPDLMRSAAATHTPSDTQHPQHQPHSRDPRLRVAPAAVPVALAGGSFLPAGSVTASPISPISPASISPSPDMTAAAAAATAVAEGVVGYAGLAAMWQPPAVSEYPLLLSPPRNVRADAADPTAGLPAMMPHTPSAVQLQPPGVWGGVVKQEPGVISGGPCAPGGQQQPPAACSGLVQGRGWLSGLAGPMPPAAAAGVGLLLGPAQVTGPAPLYPVKQEPHNMAAHAGGTGLCIGAAGMLPGSAAAAAAPELPGTNSHQRHTAGVAGAGSGRVHGATSAGQAAAAAAAAMTEHPAVCPSSAHSPQGGGIPQGPPVLGPLSAGSSRQVMLTPSKRLLQAIMNYRAGRATTGPGLLLEAGIPLAPPAAATAEFKARRLTQGCVTLTAPAQQQQQQQQQPFTLTSGQQQHHVPVTPGPGWQQCAGGALQGGSSTTAASIYHAAGAAAAAANPPAPVEHLDRSGRAGLLPPQVTSGLAPPGGAAATQLLPGGVLQVAPAVDVIMIDCSSDEDKPQDMTAAAAQAVGPAAMGSSDSEAACQAYPSFAVLCGGTLMSSGAPPPPPQAAPPAAAPPAAAPPAPLRLPAGFELVPDCTDPHGIEQQLLRLSTQGLRVVLPVSEYVRLMRGLRVCFDPFTQGRVDAGLVEQLQCKYGYLQAAVQGGEVGEVMEALHSMLADKAG